MSITTLKEVETLWRPQTSQDGSRTSIELICQTWLENGNERMNFKIVNLAQNETIAENKSLRPLLERYFEFKRV